MEYGTGAIFGCPAHDQRDLDFVNKYGLGNTGGVARRTSIRNRSSLRMWPSWTTAA
jgi:leucyl-tRNA synthetase